MDIDVHDISISEETVDPNERSNPASDDDYTVPLEHNDDVVVQQDAKSVSVRIPNSASEVKPNGEGDDAGSPKSDDDINITSDITADESDDSKVEKASVTSLDVDRTPTKENQSNDNNKERRSITPPKKMKIITHNKENITPTKKEGSVTPTNHNSSGSSNSVKMIDEIKDDHEDVESVGSKTSESKYEQAKLGVDDESKDGKESNEDDEIVRPVKITKVVKSKPAGNPMDPPVTINSGVFAESDDIPMMSCGDDDDDDEDDAPLSYYEGDAPDSDDDDAPLMTDSDDEDVPIKRRVEAIRLITEPNGQKKILPKNSNSPGAKKQKLAPMKIKLSGNVSSLLKKYGESKLIKKKSPSSKVSSPQPGSSEKKVKKKNKVLIRTPLADDDLPVSVKLESHYYKPFTMNWKREIVIRKVYNNVHKTRPSDVYYYSPTGEKLRSFREIKDYIKLHKMMLSCDNFTFLKHPMHKPPMEIVRNALARYNNAGCQLVKGQTGPTPTIVDGVASTDAPAFDASAPAALVLPKTKKRSVGRPKSLVEAPPIVTGSRRIKKPAKYESGAAAKDIDALCHTRLGGKQETAVKKLVHTDVMKPVVVSKNGVKYIVTPPPGLINNTLKRPAATPSADEIDENPPKKILVMPTKVVAASPPKKMVAKKSTNSMKKFLPIIKIKQEPINNGFSDMEKEIEMKAKREVPQKDTTTTTSSTTISHNNNNNHKDNSSQNSFVDDDEEENLEILGTIDQLVPPTLTRMPDSSESDYDEPSPRPVCVATPAKPNTSKYLQPATAAQIMPMPPSKAGFTTAIAAAKKLAPMPTNGIAASALPVRLMSVSSLPGASSRGPASSLGPATSHASNLCGMRCPGLEKIPPSLHCERCMCMFHPQCVSKQMPGSLFVCQNCQKTNNIAGVTRPASYSAAFQPTMQFMPKVALSLNTDCISDGVGGRVLTLPETMSRRLNMNEELQLKMNGATYIVQPNCFVNCPDGSFKVLLPTADANTASPSNTILVGNPFDGRFSSPVIVPATVQRHSRPFLVAPVQAPTAHVPIMAPIIAQTTNQATVTIRGIALNSPLTIRSLTSLTPPRGVVRIAHQPNGLPLHPIKLGRPNMALRQAAGHTMTISSPVTQAHLTYNLPMGLARAATTTILLQPTPPQGGVKTYLPRGTRFAVLPQSPVAPLPVNMFAMPRNAVTSTPRIFITSNAPQPPACQYLNDYGPKVTEPIPLIVHSEPCTTTAAAPLIMPEPYSGKRGQDLQRYSTDKKKIIRISVLNPEILLNIFSHLSFTDLSRIQRVSKSWSSIASHQKLWRRIDLRGHLLRNFDTVSNYLFNRGTVTVLDLRWCGYDQLKLCSFLKEFTRLQVLGLYNVEQNVLDVIDDLKHFKRLYVEKSSDVTKLFRVNAKYKIISIRGSTAIK